MKAFRKIREKENEELGFGTSAQRNIRLINRDGSFNIRRVGLPFFKSLNFYHGLLGMSWLKFNLLVLLLYIIANLFFASIYFMLGVENLQGSLGKSFFEKFLDAFFFSAQTFTTVGYGRINPHGIAPNIVAAVESMTGLLAFALATGLLYGRFSRPHARLIYRKNALIAPYKDGWAFMCKLANEMKHELIEIEAQIIYTAKQSADGKLSQRYEGIKLERSKISFLPLTWTLVHPIDEESPLFGLTAEDLEATDAEFLIQIKAFDDTFSQNVYSRSSYKPHEIVWGGKFKSNFNRVVNGITLVDLDKIDDFDRTEYKPALQQAQSI